MSSENREPLVEVRPESGIDVRMQYPLLGMQYAEEKCFVRRKVLEMLLDAQSYLPEGMRLRVWDAWRPFALQKELFEVYTAKIVEEFHLQDVTEEERHAVICEYLAVPNPDRKHPPCHTTGGAVDVTLVDFHGRELNMGTEFDSFSLKAHAEYYEQDSEGASRADDEGTCMEAVCDETACWQGNCNGDACNEESDFMEIRERRRILRTAMTKAGFAALDSEWWHFGYGEKNWALATGEEPMYEGVFSVDEI